MTESVILRKDGEVTQILLNRPEAFNAFDLDLLESLKNILLNLRKMIRLGIVISGEGKAFCAGGDLKWALNHPGGAAAAFHELAARYHQAILEIRRMRKPVIAAINGVAAGGGFSLALACDFGLLAKSAVLRQASPGLASCIDGGGTFTLPRLVGLARALEIVAFDKPISSEQAMDWGLVTKVAQIPNKE